MHGIVPEPTKKYAPLNVTIVVYDLNSNEEIRRHKINYNDNKCRKWLQKLCVWAWNNGHCVETYNVIDEDKATT